MINWLKSRRAKPQRPVVEAQPVVEFQTRQVGAALIVSAPPGPGWHAMALAASVPPDPGRTVVVVDFPSGDNGGYWSALVQALRGRGPVRLAVSGAGSASGSGPTRAIAAQWLAEQLQAEVVAPDGTLVPVPGGSTFVANAHATGAWRSYHPDKPSEALGARFPSPEWESFMTTAPWRAGPVSVAEPVPTGLWLHATPTAATRRHSTLAFGVPVRMDVLTVILGGPEEAQLPAADLRALWEALPEEIRRRVRFASFGADLGQFAADTIGRPVIAYNGLPVSSERGIEIGIVSPDGRPTWRAFATELRYRPGKMPEIVAARPPVGGLKPLRPGLWELTANVVVEAVAAGLWVRAAGATPVGAETVRRMPVDPEWARMTVGVPGEPVGDEVSVAGAKLFAGLDPETQRVVRLVFGEAPKAAEPEVEEPTVSEWPTTEVPGDPADSVEAAVPVRSAAGEPSAPVPTAVDAEINYDIGDDLPTMVLLRRQMELGQQAPAEAWSVPVEPPPVPARVEPFLVDPGIDVDTMLDTLVAAETALDEHRGWMRRTLGDQYDSYASRVLRLLVQHPELREGELQSVVTDLVAVLVYLAAGERKADEALLSGDVDALLPFLSCVISGLQRLPVYEGVAFCGGAVDPGTHRPGAILTEVSFLNAVTAAEVALPGDAEFVIWSDSGRRTGYFEPELEPIVFLPGTRFQVLGVHDNRILLGEIGGGDQLAKLEEAAKLRAATGPVADPVRFGRSIGSPV
ncbi:hypothetical protein ACFFS4_28010 [Kutzneria kofuensis]|uniref:NAD(+)--protein-arginine ADP-ribosyltransferase n=1 Tax=Kutzneria kofuensis TaxID=103725 RepID=A0A7W9NKI2_9PSEU|nr:hypothetical protein [Kutzneria kofuensis]MBB5895416.1 hypothetical protein [Kutzneria kofuensis]